MKRSEKILLAIFGAVFLVVIGGGVVMYFAKAYNRIAGEKDRLENPFGFVVTAYRSDPEINTPATGPAAVAAKP